MEHSHDESSFMHKEPCPKCGSRDNLARYTDGHGFCFGCHHYEPANGDEIHHTSNYEREPVEEALQPYYDAQSKPLKARKISLETAQKYGYRTGELSGEQVQFAPYYRDSQVVACKVRYKDKRFKAIGAFKSPPFFGQHLQNSGKMVVVAEGEIDAMSIAEVLNNWPVWSVPNGAQGAAKTFRENLEALQKFEKVVIWFDDDEPGRKAALECAMLLPAGKARIVKTSGFKDANEMLQADRRDEMIRAVWDAEVYRPDGILQIKDIKHKALNPPPMGLPWFIEGLTQSTFGRSEGNVIAIGAGTGVGKTDFLTQQIEFDLMTLKIPVAAFFLEQDPVETLQRIAGKHVGAIFHVPDREASPEQLQAAIEAVEASGRLFLYDSWGVASWEAIKGKIEYLAVAEGVKMFYLDHLTALAAMEDDEKKALEQIMADLAGLANRLKITIIIVSHLATPDGKPHEEGGRVMIRHFKGSRAIGFWCHLMLGIERDQQDEEQRNQSLLRVLKDRKTGRATGLTFPLFYDHETGQLTSTESPF